MARNLSMLLFVLSVVLFASPTLAQERQGISVRGEGTCEVVADQLEITGTVREASTDAEDTVVAFRDSSRRAIEAVEKLNIDGLSIQQGQPSITLVNPDQGMGGMVMIVGPGGGGEAPAIDPEYVMTQDITIRMPGFDAIERGEQIEMMGLLMAACQEAGIDVAEGGGDAGSFGMLFASATQMGPSDENAGNVARLTYSDADAAIASAREDAIADARRQAEQLAALTGVALGKVIAVSAGPTTTYANDEGKLVYQTQVDVTYAID